MRIVHAPSHPEVKGTSRIRETVRNLASKGHCMDYVEIINQPNAEVLEELARCDFAIDQMYSDTPMASFATEAAWMATPCVVGGYGVDEIRRTVPESRIPPTHYCHPDHIEEALEQLIADPDYRQQLGKTVKRFVEGDWRAQKVAERYLLMLEEAVPREWLFSPQDTRYVYGGGLPERRAREVVREVIRSAGVAALQLSDKPDLERAFLEFAATQESRGCAEVPSTLAGD